MYGQVGNKWFESVRSILSYIKETMHEELCLLIMKIQL